MVLLRKEHMTLGGTEREKIEKKPEVWVNEKSIPSQIGRLCPILNVFMHSALIVSLCI